MESHGKSRDDVGRLQRYRRAPASGDPGAAAAGERPVTEMAQELGMTQPGASKHLRVLREIGLVRDRKAGKQRLYGLDARGL